MGVEEELQARKEALERGTKGATVKIFPEERAEHLGGILSRHVGEFWRTLGRNLLEMVETMALKLKPGVETVKARPRWRDSGNNMWLAGCMGFACSLRSEM